MTPIEPVAHHSFASRIVLLFSLLVQVFFHSDNTLTELGVKRRTMPVTNAWCRGVASYRGRSYTPSVP